MAGFDHLRELPDGSLTKAEVGILLDEIARLETAVAVAHRNLDWERSEGEHGGCDECHHVRHLGACGKPVRVKGRGGYACGCVKGA